MSSANTWEEHLVHYRAADALYQSGQVRSALRAFRRALELAPGDADTLWALGDCYSDLGQPWRAERFFRKARAGVSWAKRGDLLYNMGNARLDQGRPAAALSLYARVPKRSTAFELARKNTT